MPYLKGFCLTLAFLACMGCGRSTPPAPPPAAPVAIKVTTADSSATTRALDLPADHPLAKAAHIWLKMSAASQDWQHDFTSYAPVRRIQMEGISLNFVGDRIILNRRLVDGQAEQVSRQMTTGDRELLRLLEDTFNGTTGPPNAP